VPVHVRQGVALAPLTTLQLGGRAARYAELADPADLPGLVAHSRSSGLIPLALGGGSNVLVADTGFDGLVVRMATAGIKVFAGRSGHRWGRRSDGHGGHGGAGATGSRADRGGRPGAGSGTGSGTASVTGTGSRVGDTVFVSVQAGHSLQDLVDFSIAEGLSGLECLTGIPGTVGATPIQNVGAYGQEVADTVVEVEAWDWLLDRQVRLTNGQCAFQHRSSLFKRSARWLILRITFALAKAELGPPITYPAVADAAGVPVGGRVSVADTAAAVHAVRTKKGMVLDPMDPDRRSVGSVFLSPVISADNADRLREAGAPVNDFPDGRTRVSASWLIREAGYQLGQALVPGVRISGKHYTLVADNGARASAFAEASALVAAGTLEATGIQLTAEPDLIGHLPRYAKLTEA
jgi:UDP-N-acetylmuramate dehydrogenase